MLYLYKGFHSSAGGWVQPGCTEGQADEICKGQWPGSCRGVFR